MKLSETIQSVKSSITPDAYNVFLDSVKELHVYHPGISAENIYNDPYGINRYFCLTISRRNTTGYAILIPGGFTYTKESQPEGHDQFIYESIPSEREEEYIQNTRFSLEDAIRIAEEEVVKIRFMGKTYAEWLEHNKNK